MLYRAWRPSCNNLHLLSDTIATDYYSYILDYSDTLHYGTEIIFRCLPGYMLDPTMTQSYVRIRLHAPYKIFETNWTIYEYDI